MLAADRQEATPFSLEGRMTGRPCDFSAIPAPGAWTQRAACKGMTTEFFPSNGPGSAREAVPRRLKNLCADCSVRNECLAYALEFDVHGVWAGTSWAQRNRMKRRSA